MRNGLAFGGLCLLAAIFSHVFAQDDPTATDERLAFRVVERKERPQVEISVGDLRLVAPEFVLAHADGSESRVQATRQGIEMRRRENALKAKTTWLALRGSPFRYSGRAHKGSAPDESDRSEPGSAVPCEPVRACASEDVNDGKTRVEIEGMELTEEQERVLSEAMESLLQEAISRAVTEGIERARKQLQISGELEEKLFAYPLAEPSEDSVVSVYLTKPGKESTPPETIELTADGEVILRFCRLYAATEKPYAVMTQTRATDGKVQIRETALTFEKGEWVPRKVSTVKRDVDDGP